MYRCTDDELHLQGCGLAYGTKEGRLRILTHSSRPLLGSKKAEHGRLEDELLAAAEEDGLHSSDEEG